mgnify:CR=1 FL=1
MEADGLLQRQTGFLLKKMNKAARLYRLIGDGDRILVAVSGGKDSLTLLRLLLAQRETQRLDVHVVVGHVVIEEAVGAAERAAALQAHCRELGVECIATPLPMNEDESWPLSCQRCAWNRRKALFLLADRLRCNKVALGHHEDDAAQTVLLNLFHSGRLAGLPPARSFFGGRFTVIRPLILTPEKEIAAFARRCGYPIGHVECPSQERSRRVQAAALLRRIEKLFPGARRSLWRAAERSAL